MALINRKKYPYIFTEVKEHINQRAFYIDYRADSFVHTLRNWDDGSDYWYCEVFHGNAFDTYRLDILIDPETLSKIRNKNEKTYLYVCNSHEAFTFEFIDPLYQSLVVNQNIPAHKIIVANDCSDLHLYVKDYADKNGFEYLQVEYVVEFEATTSFEALYNGKLQEFKSLDINKTYPKKFLNFNRRWRLHRPTLVAMLYGYGLLDKGYVSLGASDDKRGWDNVYNWVKGFHLDNATLTDLFNSIESDIMKLGPLYLDFDDLMTNRAFLEKSIPTEELYKNSLLSVVTETTFYTKGGFNPAKFLSEKTFKPMVYGHPFIIVSVPHSLDVARQLGYKTFHPYIDESYDVEMDDSKRLIKIVEEIKRISMFTDDQVKEFIQNIKPLVDYNQSKIFSKTYPSYDGSDHSVMQKNFVYKTL